MINSGKLNPRINAMLNSTKENVVGVEKAEHENKLSTKKASGKR